RITIEKRLNEMIVSESGDDLCLICFNAVPKGNSEQHKGSAQHAHSLGHYQTILEMMNVVKKLYNPDTQEEAFKLAEAYEDKLKVDCTTQHCSLCKEYYADMTRGKHLKDAMHCRLMRLAITVVGVSKAIKEQNSKNLQQFIQIHEGRLFGKKEPSSFCEICQRIVYPPYLAHGFTKLHNYNVYNLEELVICLHPLKTYINESMDSE
ncbi:uncharacterized protein LOC102801183, partial [Saccoglossus kowalevskii]|uniref:Uncharacterized protein LOC102801183 n=1 Tax=Saccoglossus kowalevskii TaxID=10224 RepID=A0ABM0LYX3_SACKO